MSTVPQKPKPGGAAFVIPVLLWVVSVAVLIGGIVYGVSQSVQTVKDFERVDLGTSQAVELDAGNQRIWLERPGIDDGYSSTSVTATVTGPDGQEVRTSTYIGDLDYAGLDGKDGTAVLTFNAPTSGQYTIDAEALDGGGGQLAIGKDNPLSEAAAGVVIGIVAGTLLFLVAVIVLIVMLVKRSGSKKRIRAAALASQGYGAAPGYAAPGGYGTPPPPGGYGSPPPPPPGGGWGGPPPPT